MNVNRNNSVWITWENQIRNKSLSARLEADFHPIVYRGNALFRYAICSVKTMKLLFKYRNGIVFVQNPSIILSLIAVLFSEVLRYTVIIDAHNAGVFPGNKLQAVANFINKKADYVIVTNQGLADYICKLGGRPIILPDPLPDVSVKWEPKNIFTDIPLSSVMAICSWASDEPYLEIIKAAKFLPEIVFYITGNSKGKESVYEGNLPPNLVITGYISDEDYHNLLARCGIILDLTTREDCLVCGAYEAISACKPIILSDTLALKTYFGTEAVYVENDAISIASGVKKIWASYEEYSNRAVMNKSIIEKRWQSAFRNFKDVLSIP